MTDKRWLLLICTAGKINNTEVHSAMKVDFAEH
jgi:hypothetical protein